MGLQRHRTEGECWVSVASSPMRTPQPRLPIALGQSWGWTNGPAGFLLSVLFLWASEVPPQEFPLGPLLLTLLLEWVALGTEQGSDWVTAALVWEAQVSWWCPSSGQQMVQGDSQRVH